MGGSYENLFTMAYKRKLARTDDWYRCHLFDIPNNNHREILVTLRDLHHGYYIKHRFILEQITRGLFRTFKDIRAYLQCTDSSWRHYMDRNPLIHEELARMLKLYKGRRKNKDVDDLEGIELL